MKKMLLLILLVGCSNSFQPQSPPEAPVDINQIDLLTATNIEITASPSNVYTSPVNSGNLTLNYSIKNIGATVGKLKINLPYLKNLSINQNSTSCSILNYQSLKSTQSCNVSLTYDTTNSILGILPYNINVVDLTNGNIKSEQGILNITTTSSSTPTNANGCKTNYHLENRKCILNTQPCSSLDLSTLKATAGIKVFNPSTLVYGACTPTQCVATYNLYNNSCIATLSQACSPQPANSTLGTRTSTDNGTTWSACTGYVCNSLFHLNAGSCVSNTQACTITNGTGSQTWNGTSWGTCTVSSCNTNYNIYNNSCVATQTRVCNPQPANSTGGTQTSLDAGTTWSTCTGYSCQTSFHNVSGSCISNTQTCTITNGAGTQTWNGTAWGTCTVSSCYGGYTSYNNTCILIQYSTCNPQPANSTGGTRASYDNGLTWATCSGFTCTNVTYHGENGVCVSNTKIITACSSLPSNATYNGGISDLIGTWTGSYWSYGSSIANYDATGTTGSCGYQCSTGSAYDSGTGTCIRSIQNLTQTNSITTQMVQPKNVVVSPDSRFIYVADADGTIAQISKNTSSLSWLSPFKINSSYTGGSPYPLHINKIVMSADGFFVYFLTYGGFTYPNQGSISQFKRDIITGQLTPLTPASVAVNVTYSDVVDPVISSDGKYLYYLDISYAKIMRINRDPSTGLLASTYSTAVTLPNSSNADKVTALAINGSYVYVASTPCALGGGSCPIGNMILAYSINSADGSLTSIGNVSAYSPQSMTFSPDGLFMYTVKVYPGNIYYNDMDIYKVNANGTLSFVSAVGWDVNVAGKNILSLANKATSVIIPPDGKTAYVTYNTDTLTYVNGTSYLTPSNNILQYNRDLSTGLLTLRGAPALSNVWSNPTTGVASPDGLFIYTLGFYDGYLCAYSR